MQGISHLLEIRNIWHSLGPNNLHVIGVESYAACSTVLQSVLLLSNVDSSSLRSTKCNESDYSDKIVFVGKGESHSDLIFALRLKAVELRVFVSALNS